MCAYSYSAEPAPSIGITEPACVSSAHPAPLPTRTQIYLPADAHKSCIIIGFANLSGGSLNASLKDSTLVNSVLIFVAGASYGFIVPVVKTANGLGVFPTAFLPMQYLVALIACVAFMLIRRIPWGRPKNFLPMALLGLFTGGTSICYYTAVTLLPSSVALTLLFQYVWISVILECIQKRKLPSRSSVIAIAVVLVGTVFATGLFDGSTGDLDPVGVIFGLASALFYALFLFFSGIIGAGQPVALKATMLAAGGVLVTSIANPGAYANYMFDPTIWPYSCALAVMGILFPTTIINYASPKLTAGMVSIMASSELPVGILAAWMIVGDTPSPLVLFGAALVLVGIVLKQVLAEKPARE